MGPRKCCKSTTGEGEGMASYPVGKHAQEGTNEWVTVSSTVD